MFHSLPAAAIAGQVTFLAFSHDDPMRRYFISGAVVLGFLSHLVMDEIWSVRLGQFGAKAKKAFGTAMKFHGPVLWSNVVTYVLVVALGLIAATEAARTERMSQVRQQMEQAARPYQTVPAPGITAGSRPCIQRCIDRWNPLRLADFCCPAGGESRAACPPRPAA